MTNNKKYSKKQMMSLYYNMISIRKMEEKIYELYIHGKLFGMSPHLYIGEEAVAVGVCQNLKKEDYIISTHRGHGHCLAKGGDLKKIFAEILGKDTGYCHGLGGSMHIADLSVGNIGANGIVGGGLPISVGAGISIKYRNTKQVCVCFFGDAASNQGTFHESLNFTSAFNLPVIFVCENNLYGLSTLYNKVSATPDIADRAKAYGIPGIIADGMNVLDVYEKAGEMVDRARNGKGPSLIECKTYRFMGHGASDHKPYRTKEEEQEWLKKCPVQCFKEKLINNFKIPVTEIKKINRTVEKEIEEALEYAFNSPEPDLGRIKEALFFERNNI